MTGTGYCFPVLCCLSLSYGCCFITQYFTVSMKLANAQIHGKSTERADNTGLTDIHNTHGYEMCLSSLHVIHIKKNIFLTMLNKSGIKF